MRVAALTWTDRRAGGIETYLETILPLLTAAGHVVSLWHEASEPADRPGLSLPADIEWRHCADGDAVGALRAWTPDVVVSNGLDDAGLEADLMAVAPSVLIAHNYHGTCISGTKCWNLPSRQPCSRVFGAACLALYFPRRCGGLSPVTMTRMYARSRQRLRTVTSCRGVVVLSTHMRDEYLRHGVDPTAIAIVPYGPPPPARRPLITGPRDQSVRLVSVGRLEPLKGVDLLIDALPLVTRDLGRPVVLTVAGEGSHRMTLEERAARVQAAHSGVHVRFAGWLEAGARGDVIGAADLLVLPSVWPEPFGIAGLEAAHLAVPSVAFAVGGVSDWLIDGETGRLAPANPPTASGLSAAIVSAVRDPQRHARMREAAAERAAARSPGQHAAELGALLAAVAEKRHAPAV